jgi:hypothetical protein
MAASKTDTTNRLKTEAQIKNTRPTRLRAFCERLYSPQKTAILKPANADPPLRSPKNGQ